VTETGDEHRPFLSLAKTCDKLGIAVWDYLGSRLRVAGHIVVQPLDHYASGLDSTGSDDRGGLPRQFGTVNLPLR
jgi:hypothetical protein